MIEGHNLTRRYGVVAALRDASISVPEGEIRGLIGPNGAGKSTLIDVLSGRAENASGTVSIQGRDVTRLSAQERRVAGLGRSFQRTNIFANLTIADQLEIAGFTVSEPNVEEVMAELGLLEVADEVAGQTSYGIQRRVDLALALIGRPKVLLLDEPAAGLSAAESIALSKMLRDLVHRWRVTVLIVEHDMEVVFSICDRITVLHLGQILTEGTPAQIRTSPEVVKAYLGSAA